METEYSNGNDRLNDETRGKLKKISRAFLRLHKILLDAAKEEYEAVNGKIPNPNAYLTLVLDDPHFAWLRKISSLIALIDEAASIRRPAAQAEAQALIDEAKILLEFADPDDEFNERLQKALQNRQDAVVSHNDTLEIIRS